MTAAVDVPPQLVPLVNKQRKFALTWNRASSDQKKAMKLDGLR